MDELLKYFSSSRIIPLVITMVAFAALIQLLTKFLRVEKEKVKGSEKFFKALDEKFDLSLVNDISDIMVLYHSFLREDLEIYNVTSLLEDYLKYLSSTHYKDDKSNNDLIKKRYDFIRIIVQEENKEKPFANVPEEERRLLKSLRDSVNHDDKEAIGFNLNELSTLIATRNKIYNKAQKINRWSLPLAVIGLITTILFGIFSLTQTINYDKLSQNVIDKMRTDSLIVKQPANKQINRTP